MSIALFLQFQGISDCLKSWKGERKALEMELSATEWMTAKMSSCSHGRAPSLGLAMSVIVSLRTAKIKPICMHSMVLTHMIIVILLFLAQSIHEGRIYQLKLFCDKDYPDKPPSVRFHSKIHMICVNQHTGLVIKTTCFFLSSFYTIYTILRITTLHVRRFTWLIHEEFKSSQPKFALLRFG